MNPNRVDSAVDLVYGLLIAVSIGLILVVGTETGVAFGFGVLVSFVIHIAWKMARFDPEWMTSVQATVDEAVGESVEETVDETVGEAVDESVEEAVGETVEDAVEEAVGETVEETVSESVEEAVDESVEETVSESIEEAVEEQLDAATDAGSDSPDGDDESEP